MRLMRCRGRFLLAQAREQNPNRLVFRSGAPGDRVLSVAPDRLPRVQL